MTRKKRGSPSPLDGFFEELRITGEILLVAVLRRLIKDKCGLDIPALTAPYLNKASNEPVNNFKLLKEQSILSKMRSQELRAKSQLKLTEMKVDKERFKLDKHTKKNSNPF